MNTTYHITEEQYINPYNFVSIDEVVSRGKMENGTLSGRIICDLETLSPLFIPNTTKDLVFSSGYSHSYDFFSYEDLNLNEVKQEDMETHHARPIIPGSSIRGVIRSAYEAALNGCMSSCDDENTLYRRSPVPRTNVGIIEKDSETDEYVLYKASKGKWPVASREGHRTGERLKGGIYLRGEDFSGKKNDAIMLYELKGGEKVAETRFSKDSREWGNFVEVWRLYQSSKAKYIKGVNQKKGHSGYKDYFSADAIPVYYTKLENGDFYYMAPAAITKEVFSHTLKELLEIQGEHQPCVSRDSICPVCALFGMVGEGPKGEGLASRLMFRDGTPIAPENTLDWRGWYEKVRTLPILSSPKVSATEFYMQDVEGADYFNYDYSVSYDEDSPKNTLLDSPKLRGRKFYWHRESIFEDKTKEFQNQRTEIRPITENKKFKCEIMFDRLTKDELETFLWVLTFGEDNSRCAHKLGHGKPYGYGSVRITKAEVEIITLDENLLLTLEKTGDYIAKKPDENLALKEYLKLTDYLNRSDLVEYPKGDKGGKADKTIYDWFSINKEIKISGVKPSFNKLLPKPLENPILPGYSKDSGKVKRNTKASKFEKQTQTRDENRAIGRAIDDCSAEKNITQITQYGSYTARQIKGWLNPYQKDKKTLNGLKSFAADYERAQSESDKRYKDLEHLIEEVRVKLQKV